jgi:sphingomyelin phosphodiesterase acid-like 3
MTRHLTRHYGRALSTALMLPFLLTFMTATSVHAATSPTPSVVMLSDIHFDPFHDPAKFAQLRKATVTSWPTILDSPDSANQAQDFAGLQKTCGARGIDTPNALLKSSVRAAQVQDPKPLFVTLSGDLMAHQFDCRFHTLAPGATAADYSAFAAKTVSFVAYELWLAFPDTPIYIALGNNDSGCKDYSEDPNSAFLKADAIAISANAKSPHDRFMIEMEFGHHGDYSIMLPKPLGHTRLVVLQDIFESKKYSTCSGTSTDAGSKAQLAWLRAQLASARKAHQTVWLMAHIPPGIDAYSTLTKAPNVCGGDAPVAFLSSDGLLKAITDYADVTRLALFGHTHMDELRIYKSTTGGNFPQSFVPGKLVPSISPVNGNNPAFTIAEVDPSTASLKDYTVFAADNQTGVNTIWTKEYSYKKTYGLPDMSGISLEKLTSNLAADKASETQASADYQQNFFVGNKSKISMVMKLAWPAYTCAMTQGTAEDYRSCVCPAATPVASTATP